MVSFRHKSKQHEKEVKVIATTACCCRFDLYNHVLRELYTVKGNIVFWFYGAWQFLTAIVFFIHRITVFVAILL